MKRPGKMVFQVIESLFRKPATVQYPFEKIVMPQGFRGRIEFYPGKCIGCKFCMRDCPSNAITITKIGEKQFQAEIDLDKCIYCAQCVESCPKKALEATKDFELAVLDKNKLKVIIKDEKASPAEDPEKKQIR